METNLPFIKILLIDDQPATLIGSNRYPEVINDCDTGDERFVDIEKYFKVKWLQNMNDLREYRNLCHEVEDRFGTSFIGDNGWVPEIVCFDYALSPGKNENTGIPDHIKQSNPNLLLTKYSQKHSRLARSYSDQEKIDIKAPKVIQAIEHLASNDPYFKDLNNTEKLKKAEEYLKENRNLPFYEPIVKSIDGKDNMGCFGGGLIVSQFRKHPCVGIPTTSKSQKSIEGNEAEFFEWLIEDDLNNTFFHDIKVQKWTVLLPKAVGNLRTKIKSLVTGNKITIALGQLLQLANPDNPETEKAQIFTFCSDFGKHSLPLNGLFIDVEINKRAVEVTKFFAELLDKLIENVKNGMDVEVLREVYKLSNKLYDGYLQDDKLFKRIDLSYLRNLKKYGNILPYQELQLNQLEADFKKTKDYCGLQHLEIQGDKKIKLRFIIYFVMLKVYKSFVDFSANQQNKNSFSNQDFLFEQPNDYDYMLALFPRPLDPDVLPIHDSTRMETFTEYILNNTGLSIRAILKAQNKNMIITAETIVKSEEKALLQAYALGIGLESSFPEWIK